MASISASWSVMPEAYRLMAMSHDPDALLDALLEAQSQT
jgi:hypothetical protein